MKVETGRTGFEREDRKSGIRKLAFLLACPLTSVARFAAGLQGKPAELGGWDKVMSRGKEYCWGRSFEFLEIGAERKGRPQEGVCYKLDMKLGIGCGGE